VALRLLQGTGPNGRVVEHDVLAYAEQVSRLRVSATALEVAFERGVDLLRLKGSGLDGRIMREDVEAVPAAAPGPAAPRGRRVLLTAMRRIVAQRMALSKSTIPHFSLTMDVDMTEAVRFRRDLASSQGRKVSFNDLLIRACTLAFAKIPEMNAAWADGAVILRDEVNIGLAVGLEGGLIVPVVRNCERKTLDQIAEATVAVIEKARNKRLTPDEYEGGCMTISNLGMYGVDTVVPIINPGEVAILGVGRIASRAVVRGGSALSEVSIVIRQITTLVIACDHRVVDGVIGARFFQAIKEALESPQSLT
jgi:pyruvate dehydrogenase E2 component (dihydrolipoamide acetyltransferase)